MWYHQSGAVAWSLVYKNDHPYQFTLWAPWCALYCWSSATCWAPGCALGRLQSGRRSRTRCWRTFTWSWAPRASSQKSTAIPTGGLAAFPQWDGDDVFSTGPTTQFQSLFLCLPVPVSWSMDPCPPIIWPLNMKSLTLGKDPDAGKDWRQKEKRATEDEMVR